MKKYLTLLIVVFSLSTTAQNIVVNGTNVNISQDVSFPYWLDSMATIEIGSQVVSISALEFNIVPTSNGNSLVFLQTKTITIQETVPNGKTWKVEGVLLDSTATSTSTASSGNTTIVSGGEKAVALSEQSANTMNMGDAMLYCDSLVEGGYDNWVVPTLEEIMFVAGGGGVVPGTRSSDYLWSISMNSSSGNERIFTYNFSIRLSDGSMNLENNIIKMGYSTSNPSTTGGPYIASNYLRCVRHATASTSSTNGASTPSSLGAGMPTELSNESVNSMLFVDAMTYCDTLVENGNADWVMPTLHQLVYATSGGCVIPDAKTENLCWTHTPFGNTPSVMTLRLLTPYTATNANYSSKRAVDVSSTYGDWGNSYGSDIGVMNKCRCVR